MSRFGPIFGIGGRAMMKMSLRPLPERISITLRTGRGGDEANEGWFFLSPDEWERFKVKLGNGTATIRTVEPKSWHDIDVVLSG